MNLDEKSIDLIKTALQGAFGDYFWWIIFAGIALFCKNMIERTVSGIIFYINRDYDVDDEVYILGTKKARVVRQTFTKTTFYLYDTNRRLTVANSNLGGLQIEVSLKTDSSKK